MKNKINLLLAILTIPFLTGCDLNFAIPHTDPIDNNNDNQGNEGNNDTPHVGEDPFKNEDTLYNKLFDYTSKIEIELDFSNKAIYSFAQYGMSSYEKKEMYHPCTMKITINGYSKTYEGMGARMKGNTSRNSGFVNEKGYFDKNTSRWAHFKLSFNQTFSSNETNDYYQETFASADAKTERKDRRFGGMKKFDLKWNKNYDNTYTKETYADYILREEGLIAQKTNLVQLTVKSDSDSFTDKFMVLEEVDKQSLKRNLPKDEAKGNLYKSSAWPVDYTYTDSIGVENASFTPIYDLKTNDDEPNHDVLNNFLNVVNTTGDAATAKTAISEVVDIDYFLKYSALMWVIGNPDDLRNNTNNTYTYFNSKTNKMIPIPYDNDRCFGIMKDWEIDTSTMWMSSTKRIGHNRDWNENPLLWRTLFEENTDDVYYSDDYPVIQEWRSQYLAYCEQFANKYLDANKFKTFTNQFHYANKDVENGGANNMSFATYAANKLNAIKEEKNA